MILNDNQIVQTNMISPLLSQQARLSEEGYPIISKGVSSFGYDISLAPELKAFRLPSMQHGQKVVDPKDFDPSCLVDLTLHTGDKGQYFIMAPYSYALGRSQEQFKVLPNVLGICLGKSTYARTGLVVNTTPLEPGWEGYLTLEFANLLPWPIKVYAGEGIGQVIFLEGKQPSTTYANRSGKYQHQGAEIVTARV